MFSGQVYPTACLRGAVRRQSGSQIGEGVALHLICDLAPFFHSVADVAGRMVIGVMRARTLYNVVMVFICNICNRVPFGPGAWGVKLMSDPLWMVASPRNWSGQQLPRVDDCGQVSASGTSPGSPDRVR